MNWISISPIHAKEDEPFEATLVCVSRAGWPRTVTAGTN